MAYSTQEVTDRWKTGDITWYGDYIDDKSCGTGKYGLPEKEVDENDSGEGTKTRYEHRRSVCLCEDAAPDASRADMALQLRIAGCSAPMRKDSKLGAPVDRTRDEPREPEVRSGRGSLAPSSRPSLRKETRSSTIFA